MAANKHLGAVPIQETVAWKVRTKQRSDQLDAPIVTEITARLPPIKTAITGALPPPNRW